MSKPLTSLAATAIALVLGVSAAHAALTTEVCLAKKRNAQGKFQQCRAAEEAKALQGKPGDLAKCSTKFQDQIAKLTGKASDAGIGCRYRDNGDGTVSDYDTGLQWEKKEDGGGLHNVNGAATWSSSGTEADGSAFTSFLGGLNNCSSAPGFFGTAGFAFHCDWRLPTPAELQSIVADPVLCGMSVCRIDPIFGPTAADFYWSSTRDVSNSSFARAVDFGTGAEVGANKITFRRVRAVRGGL